MSAPREPAAPRAGRRSALAARVEAALLWLAGAALLALALLALFKPSLFGLPSLRRRPTRAAAAAAPWPSTRSATSSASCAWRCWSTARRCACAACSQVHLFTAGLAVLLPFKLGDLVRIREVGRRDGPVRTGLLAVWLERTMDAAVLAVLVIVAAIGVPDSLGAADAVPRRDGDVRRRDVVLITVVPDNIRELMLHLVRRPFGERSVSALRVLRARWRSCTRRPRWCAGACPPCCCSAW